MSLWLRFWNWFDLTTHISSIFWWLGGCPQLFFPLYHMNICHVCHSLSLASVKSRLVLVPAHLGNPGQSPKGCKMDLCMCVLFSCLTQLPRMLQAVFPMVMISFKFWVDVTIYTSCNVFIADALYLSCDLNLLTLNIAGYMVNPCTSFEHPIKFQIMCP